MTESEIKVGEICFIRLTGEPVFVLYKTAARPNPYSGDVFIDDTVVVRRYKQSQQYGGEYLTERFTAAELITQSLNNPQQLLDQLFANQAAEEVEIEVLPEEASKPAVN